MIKIDNWQTGLTVYKLGLGNTYHRPNGPARYLRFSGDGSWWLYGQCHRYYGPATFMNDWYMHGECIK